VRLAQLVKEHWHWQTVGLQLHIIYLCWENEIVHVFHILSCCHDLLRLSVYANELFNLFLFFLLFFSLQKKSIINTNRKSTMHFPMSLRWLSYIAPMPLKWGTQNGRFWFKIAFRLKKVSLCKNCQRQVAFIGLTTVQNSMVQATPSTWICGSNWPRWSEIAHLRSTEAVTPGDKVQLTLIGSPLRAFQRAQDEHCTLSLISKRVAQKCKVFKIWISCDNSEMVWDRMLLLITNRKSHTGFRLVPTSMTLNDLEQSNSPYLFCVFFTECDCFAAQFRHSGWR